MVQQRTLKLQMLNESAIVRAITNNKSPNPPFALKSRSPAAQFASKSPLKALAQLFN
jgi:hypothetical protein